MDKVNKLEVLRSDTSIRQNIKSLIDSGSISVDESIHVDSIKISELLDLTVSNVEIEDLIDEKASLEMVNIGVHDDALPKLSHYYTKETPQDNMIYTASYGNCIKNNKVLQANCVDSVRGNVISVQAQDSTYVREFNCEDHQHIQTYGEIPITNTKDQYKKYFLITDAFNQNKISNCFQGQDLSKGAAMSFWVKYDDKRSIIDNRGLIAFIGDYERHYFDSDAQETDTEYADGSTHLSVSTLFNVEYKEYFFNTYRKAFDIGLDRRSGDPSYDFWRLNYDKDNVDEYGKNLSISHSMHRGHKSWNHIIISFTNEEIDVYVNGTKVNYGEHDAEKGKRFNKHETGQPEYSLRTSVLDFLSNPNTDLYLCMSLDEKKDSSSAFFDDVTFFNKSIETAEEAYNLYQEAYSINLP